MTANHTSPISPVRQAWHRFWLAVDEMNYAAARITDARRLPADHHRRLG